MREERLMGYGTGVNAEVENAPMNGSLEETDSH